MATPSRNLPTLSDFEPPVVKRPRISRQCKKIPPPSFSKPPQFVTIIVSKASTEQKFVKFVIHKELICFHSPFFDAAFNGNFIEGQTQEMRMDDVDDETFGQLVHWLYTQELERTGISDLLVLGKLWILAERALLPKLQNTTIDALCTLFRGPDFTQDPDCRHVRALLNFVFGQKDEEYPVLQSLLVDHFAYLKPHQLNAWADYLPKKLLALLTKKICTDREGYDGQTRPVLYFPGKKATDYYVKPPTDK